MCLETGLQCEKPAFENSSILTLGKEAEVVCLVGQTLPVRQREN